MYLKDVEEHQIWYLVQLHYGAQWPNNIITSDAFNITRDGNKKTGIDDWHVYSVQWDAENIKIYCDGKC